MVVSGIYKIHRDLFSIFIPYRIPILIFLHVYRLGIIDSSDANPLDAYSLFLIQPYRIFIQIDKCLFGVSIVFFQTLF